MKLKPGQSRIHDAAKLYGEGIRPDVIAVRLGIAKTTVHKWASTRRDLFPKKNDETRDGFKSWTEEDLAMLCRLWGEGVSSSKIAASMGRTRNSVLGMAHRQGLGGRKPVPAPQDAIAATRFASEPANKRKRQWVDAAAALWAEGASPEAISQSIGVRVTTFLDFAKRNRDRFPAREDRRCGNGRRSVAGIARPQGPKAKKQHVRHIADMPVSLMKAGNFQLSRCEGLSGKALMDLDWNDCRWPVNAPDKGGQHLFCGEEALPGKRYCAAHHPLSFTAAAAPTIARPFGAGGKVKPSGILARISQS